MTHRYICDVIEEMRKMYATRNFSGFLGLVEEMQSLANRMEASLGERKDYNKWHDLAKKEKKILKDLIKKGNKIRKKRGESPKEMPRPSYY